MGNYFYVNPYSIKNIETNNSDKKYYYKIEINKLKKVNKIEIEDKILSINDIELNRHIDKIMYIFNYYFENNLEINLNNIDFYRFTYNNINFLEIKNNYSIKKKIYNDYERYYEKVCNLDEVKWPFTFI